MRWYWRRMLIVHAMLLGSACGVTDTDEPTPVDAVIVTPTAMQLAAGATAALDAEVKDAAGNVVRNRRVLWTSSNPSIATVSENGVVTGVAAGHVNVAGTVDGKSGISSVTVVAVPGRVTTVRIVPDNVSLTVAAVANLVATPYDSRGIALAGRAIVWTTTNAGVVAVSQTGRVTGLLPGTAVITAIIDGVAGNATVAVSIVPVAKVTITPGDVSITAGKSAQLTATVVDASGNRLTSRAVTWTSSDTRIVTVDQSGLARGVRRGSSVVTATSEGKVGTATVRVQ